MAQIGTFTPDGLVAGDFPIRTKWLSIPTGTLKRGTVVTKAGAAMATGGDPYGVLAQDVDASAGAAQAVIYLTGDMARSHLILAGNAAISDGDYDKLRLLSIFVTDTVPAA